MEGNVIENRDWVARGIAFAAGVAVVLLWQSLSGPRSIEDCILQKAQGGSGLVIQLATVECANRFGVKIK